jgi:hypothetical protein
MAWSRDIFTFTGHMKLPTVSLTKHLSQYFYPTLETRFLIWAKNGTSILFKSEATHLEFSTQILSLGWYYIMQVQSYKRTTAIPNWGFMAYSISIIVSHSKQFYKSFSHICQEILSPRILWEILMQAYLYNCWQSCLWQENVIILKLTLSFCKVYFK